MSFILDALKKSENERQRHIGPSLADVQVRRRQGDRPWWAVAVGGLLVVNLGVLAVVLTRDGSGVPAPLPAPVVESAAVASSPQPQPNVVAQQPANPAVRSLADEAGAFDQSATEGAPPQWPDYPANAAPDLAVASAVPEGPPIVRPLDAPAVAPAGAVFESRPAERAEILPTHGSLIAGGTNLPELHLDIHVHSTNPADSFVFVNMRKYVEGEALREGPRIEKITPGGVILNQGGLRFLLPRL